MALKLKARDIPLVEFRRVLPDYLGPGGECFIEIDGRAAGAINAPFVMAVEAAVTKYKIGARRLGKVVGDAEYVEADAKLAQSINRARLGALYDHCVIEWRSNIQVLGDDDKARDITCDRDSFLELAEIRGVPEITAALATFEAECVAVAAAVDEADEELAGN
jgi:hypothetical protein